MSTKLNPEALAAKRRLGLSWSDDMERAYAAAIREHSQPIADERDELREALERIRDGEVMQGEYSLLAIVHEYQRIASKALEAVSKYPKTEQR